MIPIRLPGGLTRDKVLINCEPQKRRTFFSRRLGDGPAAVHVFTGVSEIFPGKPRRNRNIVKKKRSIRIIIGLV